MTIDISAPIQPDSKSRKPMAMEPVHGDLLPPLNSVVSIHLNSLNKWVDHTVVGYYVWKELNAANSSWRVFVRVKDSKGYLNARLLSDVRPALNSENMNSDSAAPDDTESQTASGRLRKFLLEIEQKAIDSKDAQLLSRAVEGIAFATRYESEFNELQDHADSSARVIGSLVDQKMILEARIKELEAQVAPSETFGWWLPVTGGFIRDRNIDHSKTSAEAKKGWIPLFEKNKSNDSLISLQEVWEAAGGNPGITPSRSDLLLALRTLDQVCDETGVPAGNTVIKSGWMIYFNGHPDLPGDPEKSYPVGFCNDYNFYSDLETANQNCLAKNKIYQHTKGSVSGATPYVVKPVLFCQPD